MTISVLINCENNTAPTCCSTIVTICDTSNRLVKINCDNIMLCSMIRIMSSKEVESSVLAVIEILGVCVFNSPATISARRVNALSQLIVR